MFNEQYKVCHEAILTAILDLLHENGDYLLRIERTGRGDVPVNGIKLELCPWSGGNIDLSLRLTSDFPLGPYRYESSAWKHFVFTDESTSPSVRTAASLASEFYDRGSQPPLRGVDLAHVVFMAGAEALLNPKVAKTLNEFDISAPEVVDQLGGSFQYILTDPDQRLKSNYCDVLLANRVMQRVRKALT